LITREDIFYAQSDYTKLLQKLNCIEDALSGKNFIFELSPATTTRAATSAAFSRYVDVYLKADGVICDWFNGTFPITIADTSSAGAASIQDGATTVTMVNGKGRVRVNGSAAAWLAGTRQVETIQVTAGCSTAGDLTVTVTAAGIDADNSVAVTVAVTTDDNEAAEVAAKIVAGLAANETIAAFFDVAQGTAADTDKVIITKKTRAANDATMQIAVAAGATGVTVGASGNTTAGVAPETNTLTVSQATLLGHTIAAKTSVETIVPA
jgi:hypothetical protein